MIVYILIYISNCIGMVPKKVILTFLGVCTGNFSIYNSGY